MTNRAVKNCRISRLSTIRFRHGRRMEQRSPSSAAEIIFLTVCKALHERLTVAAMPPWREARLSLAVDCSYQSWAAPLDVRDVEINLTADVLGMRSPRSLCLSRESGLKLSTRRDAED